MIIVDGSALVYRSHYAFIKRPLTAPGGETTSVAFGFFNSLLRLIETRRPVRLVIVFDEKGPVFRHDLYADYKANRKPMPDELSAQLPRLHELLDAWGVPVMSRAGFEADDIMATLARASDGICERVWFYTGDKDFMQLLDGRTAMLKPGRRNSEVTEFTAEDVRREYGLEPSALIDVFALSGDSSDNIPGAPGVGAKTATKLIREFGSLEALYEGLESSALTPRLKRVLAENREQVHLSRQLFRIDDAVPVDIDWDALRTRLPAGDDLRERLETLGLQRVITLVDRLVSREAEANGPEDADGSAEASRWDLDARGYRRLADADALSSWLATIPSDAPLAVDTETDGLRPDRARLVGISLCARRGEGLYVPVLERGPATQGDLFPETASDSLDWIRPLLGPVLADPERRLVGQNLKFDRWLLERHGLPLGGRVFDTMVAAYVLDPSRQRFGLDELAREHLDLEMIPYADLFATGDRTRDILSVPAERLAVYAAEDADATWRLHERFTAELAAQPILSELFVTMETPLTAVLYAMERRGIALDLPFLEELGGTFRSELADLEGEIHEAAGREFNVQSPRQLAEVLFEDLGLKPVKKTASGWSTDVSVLTALADKHPLPALVLEHRQLAKLLGTYVDNLMELVNPASGLIHTSFNQAVAATGRLSSSDPNLQNIPVRTEKGRRIRRAFVPRSPDSVFISADYSQIELRLLAHLSGDETLIETFHAGGDVHRRTAALVGGVDEDEVTVEMRSRAKAVNFGVIYGMGARALARQLGIKTREAAGFIDGYFRTYPGVKAFIARCQERARETGETETLFGRRRALPDILSENNRLRSFQERVAVNTPIQGTAADLIKLAMLEVESRLAAEIPEAMLLLQVHDELLLEAPVGAVARITDLVSEAMSGIHELDVPLVVDVHVGADWAEAHG